MAEKAVQELKANSPVTLLLRIATYTTWIPVTPKGTTMLRLSLQDFSNQWQSRRYLTLSDCGW